MELEELKALAEKVQKGEASEEEMNTLLEIFNEDLSVIINIYKEALDEVNKEK